MSQPSSFLRLNDKSKVAQGQSQQASPDNVDIGHERGLETPWLTNRHNLFPGSVAKNRKNGFPEEYPDISDAQRGLLCVPKASVGASLSRTPNPQALHIPALSRIKGTKGVHHAAPEEPMPKEMMEAVQDPSKLQVEVMATRPGEGFPGFDEVLEKLCSWKGPASQDTLHTEALVADIPAEHPLEGHAHRNWPFWSSTPMLQDHHIGYRPPYAQPYRHSTIFAIFGPDDKRPELREPPTALSMKQDLHGHRVPLGNMHTNMRNKVHALENNINEDLFTTDRCVDRLQTELYWYEKKKEKHRNKIAELEAKVAMLEAKKN